MKFSRFILKNCHIKNPSNQISKILILAFICFTSTQAIIVETKYIEDVLKYVQGQTTLVIFDLDNTVFESPYDFGGDKAFSERILHEMKNGLTADEAVKCVLPLYVEIQRCIAMRLVEPIVRIIISHLQKEHIPVIALSSRSVPIEERTIVQLLDLGIDFSVNALSGYDINLSLDNFALYKRGIVFSGQNNKGKVLVKLLEYLGIKPVRVVFIDDKKKYLLEVQDALAEQEIDFVGIRYGGADEKVKNFNPLLADAQLHAFKKNFGLNFLD